MTSPPNHKAGSLQPNAREEAQRMVNTAHMSAIYQPPQPAALAIARAFLANADRITALEEALRNMVDEFEGASNRADGTQSNGRKNVLNHARRALGAEGEGK